jgi:plasmid stabilization system protein ParE
VDYRLNFTQRSLADLAEIVEFLAADDANASSRFTSSLLDHVELLKRFPRMGSAVRDRSTVRRLVHTPILVYYRVLEDKGLVEILHFRHGSRKPPPL